LLLLSKYTSLVLIFFIGTLLSFPIQDIFKKWQPRSFGIKEIPCYGHTDFLTIQSLTEPRVVQTHIYEICV